MRILVQNGQYSAFHVWITQPNLRGTVFLYILFVYKIFLVVKPSSQYWLLFVPSTRKPLSRQSHAPQIFGFYSQIFAHACASTLICIPFFALSQNQLLPAVRTKLYSSHAITQNHISCPPIGCVNRLNSYFVLPTNFCLLLPMAYKSDCRPTQGCYRSNLIHFACI